MLVMYPAIGLLSSKLSYRFLLLAYDRGSKHSTFYHRKQERIVELEGGLSFLGSYRGSKYSLCPRAR